MNKRDKIDAAKTAYHALCTEGNLKAARLVLRLLARGRIMLGLSDEACDAEAALNSCGIAGRCALQGTVSEFTI